MSRGYMIVFTNTQEMMEELEKELHIFLGQWRKEDAISLASEKSGLQRSHVINIVDTLIGESLIAFKMIQPFLHKSIKILEVGCGIPLLSSFLFRNGFTVNAIDPKIVETDDFNKVFDCFRNTWLGEQLITPLIRFSEDLDPTYDGFYDLIFSLNTLEHVADPKTALSAMYSSLSAEGVMIHSCPNYSVPYEPHFGSPLIPGKPDLTGKLLKINDCISVAVWRSLNWISAKDVSEISRDLGSPLYFKKGVLYTSFLRLGTDESFLRRHPVIAKIEFLFRVLRITSILKLVPAKWSTPMTFLLVKNDCASLRYRLKCLGFSSQKGNIFRSKSTWKAC